MGRGALRREGNCGRSGIVLDAPSSAGPFYASGHSIGRDRSAEVMHPSRDHRDGSGAAEVFLAGRSSAKNSAFPRP